MKRRQHQPAAGEVLAALEQQQRARPHDRLQRDRPPGRQRVAGHAVERPDRVWIRQHHHRRPEPEEADAERVAVAPPARLEERDRPQQPAQRLHERRLGRPWRQRAHRRTVAPDRTCSRVRSDAPPHTGARRRNGAARHPPGAAHVLRLQRTIGNRATTRLLQRGRRLPEDAGIATTSRIDGKTRGLIQQAIEQSELLRPYLKGKFPRTPRRPRALFQDPPPTRRTSTTRPTSAIASISATRPKTKTERAKAFGGIGGFFDRKNNAIHVRSRSPFGHALHEEMHKLAQLRPSAASGATFINEGVTQYFADCCCAEHGLDEVKRPRVQGPARLRGEARRRRPSRHTVAAAYFLSDGALREALMQKLRLDDGASHPVAGRRVQARGCRAHAGSAARRPVAASEPVGATSARGGKIARSPRRCARPRRTRPRSPSRTCRASCASARSASAGRRCATLPPPAADAVAHRRRGRRRVRAHRRAAGPGLAGRAARGALAALFGRATERRAALPARAAVGRAAPGRAGGRDGRRGREGGRRARRRSCGAR